MAKLNLTYEDKIHLDKWNIDVVPQLTIDQMQIIIDIAKMQKTSFEKDEAILGAIIAACTDIYSDEDDSYTYEQIIYSGLWGDIMEACPILASNVKTIYSKLEEEKTIEYVFNKLVDKLIEKIDGIDLNQIDIERIKEVINKVEE